MKDKKPSAMASIVIPAYNEERRIGPTLQELDRALKGQPHEIIVVADGQDDTAGAVKATRIAGIRILSFKHRLGKGGALNQGITAARGGITVIYDADGAMPATELKKLLSEMPHHDIAIGTRYARHSKSNLSGPRKLAAWCFNRWIRLIFGLAFSDTQCGFKAFRTEIAKNLARKTRQRGFVWDVEMLYLAQKAGLAVVEVPIRWEEKDGGDLAQNTLQSVWKIFKDSVKLRLQYR